MTTSPLDPEASVDLLERLARHNHLQADGLEQALIIIGRIPNLAGWQRFLDYALLVLGTLFTINGVIFFFAYNWADMPPFVKFGLIEAGILVAIGFATYQGLDSLSGRAGLIMATMLVGALLAVQGQVYQTGADSYLLFLGWLIFVSGWVLISHNTIMWLIGLLLLNLTIGLYWIQVISRFDNPTIYLILALLNGFALAMYEVGFLQKISWIRARWLPRLIALATLIALVGNSFELINYWLNGWGFKRIEAPSTMWLVVSPLLYIGVTGLVFFVYSQQKQLRDLLVLTMTAFSLVAVFSYGLTQFLFDREFGYDTELGIALRLLVIGVAIMLQAGVAVARLRYIGQRWEVEHA